MKADASAVEIVEAIKGGTTTARAVVEAALARIEKHNKVLGAFTDLVAERALQRADHVDGLSQGGGTPGPLAGVPFAVKNLFDIEGVVTRAGSKINRANQPAKRDATLITRLEAAGAILVGACNMGEYAYDFTGENAHDGPSCNPHDFGHMSGGSSGGSATAVGAGFVPLALASDTNGSIRVPASFCGLFGLKPTYGRLSRAHTFPFVASLDHLGPLGRSAKDLSLAYDVMQGFDEADPAITKRANEPTLSRLKHPISGVRIGVADGYFTGEGVARDAVAHVAKALGATRAASIPDAQAARAAAYLITMAEGAELHMERLRARPDAFDPDVRDRLLAGAMLPAVWVQRAQKLRRQYRDKVLKLFDDMDAILAPATPMQAPKLGERTMLFGGVELPLRPNIGIYTQPISFIGLPVVTVPVWLDGQALPIGVQIIAAPWREDIPLRIAHQLETMGAVKAPVGKAFAEA
jgi:AtzE family amidohydrolase